MIPRVVGLDVTPLCSGHAIRGIGRYVGGILDALLSTQPEWCSEHLGVVRAGGQDAPPGVRAVWRSRRASVRPQDVGWIAAAISDRVRLRGMAVRLWHETDPGHPLGLDGSARALVTAYDLIPLLEPAVMATMRRHRRVAYNLYLRRLQEARGVLAISHTTAADLRTLLGVGSDRIKVVYPAVMDRRSQRVMDRVRRTPSILFVGVPDPHKRPSLALEAFAEYRRRGGARPFVFVGHHPPQARSQLRHLAESLQVARHVEFIDRAPDSELQTLLSEGVLLALSTREGFGLPPVECLLSGGRVVASPSPIYLEVLGDTPTFSRDDSPDAIGESLLAAEASRVPTRAADDLAQRFSPATIASGLIRVYESVMP